MGETTFIAALFLKHSPVPQERTSDPAQTIPLLSAPVLHSELWLQAVGSSLLLLSRAMNKVNLLLVNYPDEISSQ